MRRLLQLAVSTILGLILVLSILSAMRAGAGPLPAMAMEAGAPSAASIAHDDVYTTPAYIPLTVDAPGVLANDDGYITSTAVLIASPVHGDVALAADGSFVYTPPSGFTGADTFVYRADDGSTTSLVGYWSFDEGSGTRAFDLSGNGYYGTLTNGPAYTTTVPATPTFDNPYALAFDGVDDGVYVHAGSRINFGSRAQRTVSAWFNVEDKTITATKQVIWEEGGYINGLGIYVHDGTLYGGAWSGSLVSWVSTTLVTSDRWHHVALVLDVGTSPGTLTLYLDGQPTATVEGYVLAQHNNANGIGRVADDTKFHDGNFNGSPSIAAHTFGGLIDDVRVYNAALSETEVQAVMLDDVPSNLARVTIDVTPLPTASLEGTVTDSATGQPLEGASVEAVYNPVATFHDTTDADGFYGWIVPTFTYTVTAWMNYGYYPATITDIVVTAPTTTLDIALDPMPTYVVSGSVTDATAGWPLYAQIDVDGYPGDPVWTDPLTGFYSVTLASEVTYTFHVATWVDGYTGATRSVGPLTGDAGESFALLAETTFCTAPGYEIDATGLYEDFDGGVFPPTGWSVVDNGGDCVWRGDDPGARGNLTGGSGAFAIADSDHCGSGTTMNTDLLSPIVDVSSLTSVTLQFAYDFRRFANDQASVYVSDDGGTSWHHVLTWNSNRHGPALFSQDVTSLVGGSTQAQVRFRYTSGWDWWWQVDNVSLGEVSCSPRTGGLVMGHAYDANTSNILTGATVENELGHTFTSGTTDDPAVEDGFYVAFAPAGSTTLTATQEGGYGPDVDTVTVPLSGTVRHDFVLPAGRLEAAYDVLSVTLDFGATATLPLTLSNSGSLTAGFELVELNRGFDLADMEQGTIEWLYRRTTGVPAQTNDSSGSATPGTPGAYRYTPAYTTGDYTILVYTDDSVHASPDTFVEQALTYLGLPATVHVADYTGFQDSLNNGGPWDLVVWSGEYWEANSELLDDLVAYLQSGGRLAATYWGVPYNPDHALWAEMGFSYVSDYTTAPPVYWWDANHPLFTVPMDAPEWLERNDDNPFLIQGIRMEPLDNGTALAGYTTGPADDESALILRDDGRALFKGFLDVSTDADANGNGILDGTELWINILYGMEQGFEDVPWLSENPISGTLPAPGSQVIDVAFDAGAVWQPGTYYATLNVGDDTPYGVPAIPVTMTVNTPSGWGKVEGTLSGLGPCNADPAPLAGRDVRIEDGTGGVYTTTTGGTGSYAWWADPNSGPLTITAAVEGYEAQRVTGVVVTSGETTIVDLALRPLEPCVGASPTRLEYAVALGDSVTGTLDLLNSGALSTTFELTETLSWLSVSPVSGTLEAGDVQAVDLLFDSSVLTQTGLYGGALYVLSDDPTHPTLTLAVDLWVVSGTAGVALGPDSLLAAAPGEVVTHTFVLTNTGDVTDTYGLALSGHAWPTSAPASTGFLPPGESFTVSVVVTIPLNPREVSALIGSDTFTLTASSQVDGTGAAASGTTEATAAVGVALGDDRSGSGSAGEVVSYTLPVTNTGEFTDTFDLAASGSTWPVALSATSLTLGAGETGSMVVSVTIPGGAEGGSSDGVTVTATSRLDGLVSDSAVLTTWVEGHRIYLPLVLKGTG